MSKMSEKTEYLSQEGYDLIGASFEVHKEQGGGLSEEIYQESLEVELEFRSIHQTSKKELDVFYKGQRLNKTYIPDLIVFQSIIVELKAVRCLSHEHERQLLNYMRITKSPVGYLINFGPLEKLQWKRFILREFIPKSY